MAGFVAPIISGLANLFGPQQKTTTNQSQNTQGSTQQDVIGQTSGTVTPNLSPFQQQLAQLFTDSATNLNNSATNLQPYTTAGLQQIQGQGGANNQIISNAMAARGLSYSPAGTAALNQNTLNTGNQANSFLQSIPLLQRQLQTQSLQGLISSFGALPTGVSTQGNTTQTGNSNTQSSGTGNSTSTSTGGGIGSALGGFGAGLFVPGGGGNGSDGKPQSAFSSLLNLFGV